jgi:DNA-binding beta-propeller fold protein YncE
LTSWKISSLPCNSLVVSLRLIPWAAEPNLPVCPLIVQNADGVRSMVGAPGTCPEPKPTGLVLDRAGNVYVSNIGYNTISKITKQAVVTDFVTLDGGFGSALAIDRADNFFLWDKSKQKIIKVTPQGVTSDFFTRQDSWLKTDNLAFDRAGNLNFVAPREFGSYEWIVVKITPDGHVVRTINVSLPAEFHNVLRTADPRGLAFNDGDNLYVAMREGMIAKVPLAAVR